MADVIKRVDPRVAAFHDMDVVLGAWKTELVQAMHGDTADDDAASSTRHSDSASGQPELQCQRDVAATRLKTAKRTATIRRGHILDMAKLRRAANDDKAALVDAYTATDTGLRNVIEAVTARSAAAEAHVVELTTKCDGLTAANSLLEAQLVGLQSTADEHQVEVRCLENLLHASELHVLDLSSREASAVDVSTVLQSKIDKLAANLRTAVTESYECKQRHDELARMNQGLVNADTQQKSDLVALQVRLKVATASVQASAQELHALAVKKDAVIARLRDELAAAKTDAERAIAEAVRTRQDALDAASMEQEAARMQLVDDVAAADASTNLPNLLFVDGDDFAADLQRLEDDLAASKAELAEAATAAASSQATIEALSADKLRLIATVQEQKAGLAAMSLQLRSAVARTDASTQQIESLLGEKSHLTSVVQQRDAAIAVFKAEITEAATAAAFSQATIEALKPDSLQ
ncbi:hypothetical protein SDRG_16145 [Saprolegnia diclina VS20]|uniref:Uncharacterized protein n=1 Tax=Saprolegnia diclina (strain VS20) TaxID=1156394 RepID=T0R945_SAPDV|nr:hypothetical protein SDRG_16145 [Saprolegnia diclina VS20]EQC25997.1 hypothetical protein SDRG_16145 [Saprolegnia diclina VS20]|eukprot:XP_008620565.1 hypothetical protein SDRG_16145 [Saprolegnia diclina VS20]